VSYNQFNNNRSYKHFRKTFRKNTDDFFVGTRSLESWDEESITEYCTNHIENLLKHKDYTSVFQIPKWFLKLFGCSRQTEFEEKVLFPILWKLCVKYGQDLEQVQKKIFENECISYKEDFN
jgi:hypothetical protein